MVDLTGQYDTTAKPSSNRGLIPAGTYRACIIDAKKEPISQARDLGECLALTWRVTEGEYLGHLIWQRLNLWWDGPEKVPGKVVEIANSHFAAIILATGQSNVTNTDQLLECDVLLSVTLQKNNPAYPARLEVSGVKAVTRPTSHPRPRVQSEPTPQPEPQLKSASRMNVFEKAAKRAKPDDNATPSSSNPHTEERACRTT